MTLQTFIIHSPNSNAYIDIATYIQTLHEANAPTAHPPRALLVLERPKRLRKRRRAGPQEQLRKWQVREVEQDISAHPSM
jgi:hypothetical protein